MTSTVLRFILLGIVLTLSSACNSGATQPPVGIDLLAGLKSYQTVQEVQHSLRLPATQWRVIEDSGTNKGSTTRARFDTVTVEIDGYRLAELTGVLRLEFLNDRLMATLFYPYDLAAFKARFQVPTETKLGQVRWGRDYKERVYLALEDARLRGEFMKWIRDNT